MVGLLVFQGTHTTGAVHHKVAQDVMEVGGHSFLASQSSRSALKWLASWFSKELIRLGRCTTRWLRTWWKLVVTVSWPHSLAVLHSNGWPLGFPRNSYEWSGAPVPWQSVHVWLECGRKSLASHSFIFGAHTTLHPAIIAALVKGLDGRDFWTGGWNMHTQKSRQRLRSKMAVCPHTFYVYLPVSSSVVNKWPGQLLFVIRQGLFCGLDCHRGGWFLAMCFHIALSSRVKFACPMASYSPNCHCTNMHTKKSRQRLHSKMAASHCTLCLYTHNFFFMSVMHKCPCQLLLFAKGSFENVKEEEEDADSWRCLLGWISGSMGSNKFAIVCLSKGLL